MDWFLYDNGLRHEKVKRLEVAMTTEKNHKLLIVVPEVSEKNQIHLNLSTTEWRLLPLENYFFCHIRGLAVSWMDFFIKRKNNISFSRYLGVRVVHDEPTNTFAYYNLHFRLFL